MIILYQGYFDGASKGNPGEAAIGCVLIDPSGNTVWEHSEAIGIATNNEAEYTALIRLLEHAQALNIERIHVKGDSQLVIKQIMGEWKINFPHLATLCKGAQNLLDGFKTARITWVPREENKQADRLSNMALQERPLNRFTGKFEKVSEYIFIAHGAEPYAVDILHDACTCPAFAKGKTRPCKHLVAAQNV